MDETRFVTNTVLYLYVCLLVGTPKVLLLFNYYFKWNEFENNTRSVTRYTKCTTRGFGRWTYKSNL